MKTQPLLYCKHCQDRDPNCPHCHDAFGNKTSMGVWKAKGEQECLWLCLHQNGLTRRDKARILRTLREVR